MHPRHPRLSPHLSEAKQAAEAAETERRGWFSRLRAGLSRSSARLNDGINTIFNRRRLDDEALEELEELLISSDMGIGVAGEVAEALRRTRFNQEVSPEEVRTALAEQVIRLVEPVTRPLRIDRARQPFVILVIGVNGSGKTTTIAKLAKQYRDQGLKVVLAAGDTFRAAAVEQLQIWGERTGCAVVARPAGSDAAGLAYDALVQAQSEGADILLIDTAGRLHNKADLMGELQKIVRVIKKVDGGGAAFGAARARRDHRPERPRPGRDLSRNGRGHRHRHDQTRRHRARRRAGVVGREIRHSDPRDRGRRDRR